jgi:hypothetical protein
MASMTIRGDEQVEANRDQPLRAALGLLLAGGFR